MSLVAALLTGGALGVRHALEADHLAAVTTLVEDDHRPLSSGVVGISWGVGHSIPIVVLGVAFVLLGVELPESVLTVLEVVVGVVLIALGVRLLARVVGLGTHSHDGHRHAHLHVGPLRLGRTHRHVDGDSLLVGVLHGFAGSGAIVVAIVATVSGLDAAVVFLGAFSLLSIVTMGLVSALWNRTLDTRLARPLKATAAILGVGIGLSLIAEQFTGVVLL